MIWHLSWRQSFVSFHILNFVTSLGFICGYLCKFDFAPLKGMHDIFIKITQHSNLRAMQSSISPRLLTEHGEIQKILRDITADVPHMLWPESSGRWVTEQDSGHIRDSWGPVKSVRPARPVFKVKDKKLKRSKDAKERISCPCTSTCSTCKSTCTSSACTCSSPRLAGQCYFQFKSCSCM